MNYNINDIQFQNSSMYQNFLKENQGEGNLKIRAFMAKEAVPVSNLKIVITSLIDNNNVTFFEGYTDESGIIEKITLPAPLINTNNLTIPPKTVYNISAYYEPENSTLNFPINMYDKICVVQNININPGINEAL